MTMSSAPAHPPHTIRHLVIGSPREPSGVAWLVNCLLELDIKTFVVSEQRMWVRENGAYRLHPTALKFQKWAPTLLLQKYFAFQQPVDALWMHDFPLKSQRFDHHILFIRDPRGAFYSRYLRDNLPVSFEQYLAMPEADTGLDRVRNWCLFTLCWLSIPGIHVCRFEDYKRDAAGTLQQVTALLDLDCSNEALQGAVESSTFDKAQKAEQMLAARDKDPRLLNRSGNPEEWRTLADSSDQRAIEHITRTTLPLLIRLGYEPGHAPDFTLRDFMPQIEQLPLHLWHQPFGI